MPVRKVYWAKLLLAGLPALSEKDWPINAKLSAVELKPKAPA